MTVTTTARWRLPAALALSAALAGCATSDNQAPAGPPVAKVQDVVETHWGVQVHDPYRYMENLEDPYVEGWFKGQADYTASVLDALPQTASLEQRLKELDAGKPYWTYAVHREADGSLFFMRRNAGESVGKLYFTPAGGEPRLLVDPETLGGDGEEHYSLELYSPSPDARYVAYGLAQGGSEETTYYVMEVASGELVGQSIGNIETAYNAPEWTADSEGFFYSRRRDLPADAPATEVYKQTSVRYHRLGSDPAADPVIAAYDRSPRMPISDVDFPSMVITPGSKYAVVKVKHGDSNEISLYSAPMDSLFEANIPWRNICTASDLVVDFAVHGDEIYLKTGQDAPRYRLVKTSLAAPDLAAATEVVPAGDVVLDAVYAAADALYLDTRVDGVNKVMRLPYGGGAPQPLPVPGDAAAYVSAVSETLPGVYTYVTAWTVGPLTYAYDPASNAFTDTGLLPKGKFDAVPGYVSEEVLVTSHDGVKVPVSILRRADVKLDGSNPTIVYGYGSYGLSMDVNFSAIRLAWLERGGVYAIAHVRGGGEYGQAWHYAGRMLNKPNTWKDAIAAGEYLVKNGYTSPEHMAVMGGSAGGILVGRAITERPDLFAAAVSQVGMTDTIRAETTTNGVPNIQEFGTVTEEDGFKGLLEMSPYAHVEDGVAYPAVLFTHGYNDPRVNPWMSGKLAARMQAATTGGPVLLRVEYGAGHGIGSTRGQVLKQYADIYSFLLWQLGDS
ncbi:S9 family peptidase [Mangrovimicrobium sediminis]|uniref:prolyl oligopeptidase n=1 Tax=Mangrovimicrobium sediminis TaxID=2562682 RepID=A0A4Z0LYE7_9GAMM|nr:prolyl oligopeptidase family serine peptidase [Haliea sp. SAOS-164]TGD72301.1 S9 family peptidase [Haliea sp. SAOS-164]